jgi:ABC-type sugar transport system ATPase subunit
MDPVLEAVSVTKDFPGVRALDNVSFSLEKAGIYGLVGENGAGKSTLLNIFLGVYRPTRGEVRVKGKRADIKSPAQAREEYGIDGVFQASISIPTLSVAENLFLGKENKFYKRGFIDFEKLYSEAEKILRGVELDIDVTTPAEKLSPGELKLVEFAKVLSHNPEIVILDEVTAPLEKDDLSRLFEIMKRLKNEGKTLLFVSHRLKEVMEITDKCLVLKDGKLAGIVETREVGEEDLIELMTGTRRGLTFPEREHKRWEGVEVVLSVKGLTIFDPIALRDINLDLRKGEIVALAGLRGQGQSELLKCIFGLIPNYRGHVYVEGRELKVGSPIDSIRHGLVRISDDKEKEELCLTLSVLRNGSLAKVSCESQNIINIRERIDAVKNCCSMFSIETPSLHQQVLNLSGGNRQKIVLSKWIQVKPKVILADQPTIGLDVGTKMEVYRILRELAREGVSILTVLTETEEVLNLPDRILVMREGRIVKELDAKGLKEDELIRSYF